MMKQISMRLLMILGMCLFLLSSCNKSEDFTVKGVVRDAGGTLPGSGTS